MAEHYCRLASSYYWSSTTNANNTDNAWNVNFNNGNVNNNNKDNDNYVRCVRGEKVISALAVFLLIFSPSQPAGKHFAYFLVLIDDIGILFVRD